MYDRIDQRKKSRRTSIGNERFMEIHAARRTEKPIVVKGLAAPKHLTITPAMYKKIDVDTDNYQRGETPIISSIVASLKEGGMVLSPPILSRRKWCDDGKLWIVDGLQRMTALMSLDMTFEVMLYEVDNLDQERAMFIQANEKMSVSPNRSIKAHPGPTATLLRLVDGDHHHPLFNRVGWGTGDPSKISAAVAVRGMVPASGAGVPGGKVLRMLAKTDSAIARDPNSKLRCATLLRMMGLMYPKTYVKAIAVESLGIVAWEKWSHIAKPEIPPPSILNRIAKINVDALVGGAQAARFRPIVIDAIKRIWKD
jgi:hypothetical protein